MVNERCKFQFVSFDGGVRCQGMLITPDDPTVLTNRAVLGNPSRLSVPPASNDSDEASALHTGGLIARGAGLSFAAASFGEQITAIETLKLNRISVLDNQKLTVTVEAGVTVGALLDFLLSHGYYLCALPGYPTITIGGCIAADVHGKQQLRDGNFEEQVESFRLHHIDHGTIDVSREMNSELFDLTLGGFGLTGTVSSVTLKVKPVPSLFFDVSVRPIADISELSGLLREKSESSDQLVSWHDLNQIGSRFGSGFLQSARFTESDESSVANTGTITFPIKQPAQQRDSLTLTANGRGNSLPPLFGRVVTGLMNSFYTHWQTLRVGGLNRLPVQQCYFPDKRSRDLYFHGFGSRGLHEYQVLIPNDRFHDYIEQVQWWLHRNDLPVTMASSKLFGGMRKLLRFNGTGICFAFDFPRCDAASRFLRFLDQLTIETQSLPNIHKDSRLSLKTVEASYTEYSEFKSRLRAFDPKRRYQSELSRRLSL